MVDVSVLILARNEESNIKDCIESCTFAKEVIVIDDNSTDKTPEIAIGLGAIVINRSMNGDWGGQQTFAINQASCDWIFFIDADERCTPALCEEIECKVKENKPVAYLVKRMNKFKFNKATHGSLRPDYVCRLMPKEGSYVEGFVHPSIITPYKEENLKNFMYHFTYDNWEQYYNKVNNYTTLAARKNMNNGKKAYFWRDIVFRPFLAFLKIYIINGGFLDGKIGWIFSVNHYMYTMMKYVKLYYLQRSNGKL